MNKVILALLLTSLLLCTQLSNAQCHLTDWSALKALYENTNGDNWTNNAGWEIVTGNEPPPDCNLSTLSGILLNGAGGVDNIFLPDNNLQGIIPTEIGQLSQLTNFSLYNNQLSGPIPAEIGNLTNLTELYANNNNFSGSIPAEIGNKNNWSILYLHNNQLSGCYANQLINLCSQTITYYYGNSGISDGNNFDATWEDFCATGNGACSQPNCNLNDWTALKALYESTNGDNWTNNTGWEIVNGDEPPTDCDLSTLYGIGLGSGGGVACIDMDGIEGCGPDIGLGNNLTGSIPSELGNLSGLLSLRLANNQLEGSLPTELGNLSLLLTMDISGNMLSGTIPKEIGNLYKLAGLNLNDNNLTGNIPFEIVCLNLLFFTLANNQFTGCYPFYYSHLCDKLYPSTQNNMNIGNNFDATWEDFCATGNGSCPPPQSICRQTDSIALLSIYQSLKPNNNWYFDQTIDNWEGVTLNENGCVAKLDLSEDGLWGVIPPEIGDLSEITYLRMVENSITGSLPAEIGNLTSLKVLSLAENNMIGPIPHSLRNLVNLETLYLNRNQFTEVPSEIGNFNGLTELFLRENQLNGCYPAEFTQLCNQLVSTTNANINTNFAMSDGNNFDATWEDFCATNAGACLQSPSAVSTNYSGNVNITVTSNENGEYVLRNNDISVMEYTNCELSDLENCTPVAGFDNWAANEIAWATEKAVQYFEDVYNISLPQVISFVNSNHNGNPNSSVYNLDSKAILYGMGDDTERTTMTAPDIVGHEFMHFIIANLNDQFCIYGECGALNESFADIFGEVLEYICKGTNDWVFGSEVMVAANSGIRSLSNPSNVNMQYQLPHTYLGNFWASQEEVCFHADLCGIHTNNGIHNYWFYLLANGGTGTNDNGLDYNVQGIGIEKAAQITFTNLFNKLNPASTYIGAIYGSINAAKDLYGENSNEVQQTINAWEAVGLTALQSNPTNSKITGYSPNGPVVGNEIPIHFDLALDSLGQDISGDGLSFSLHLPPVYQNFQVDSIYFPLTEEEVIITYSNSEINVNINRQNVGVQKTRSIAQRIKSGSTVFSVGGCLAMADVDSDCVNIPPIEISGDSEVSSSNIVSFESSTLLFGSDCEEGATLKRSGKEPGDDALSVALQLNHQTCLNLGVLKVEILNNLENGTFPYQYYLFNQNGAEISSKLESFNLTHQFYNLEEGIYQLRVEDSANRNFIKNFEVKFTAKVSGSRCCPEKLTILPGEYNKFFNATNRVSLKKGTRINTGRIEICD